MRVVRMPNILGALIESRKPALLVEASNARAVLLPVEEYERLRAVYDWHERMLKGA
jgi:uncharacterized protein (DUF1786 family)